MVTIQITVIGDDLELIKLLKRRIGSYPIRQHELIICADVPREFVHTIAGWKFVDTVHYLS